MIGRSTLLARNAFQNCVRYSHRNGGVPGENIPFQIENRARLTAWFVVFFSSGFGLPFFVLRHQLLKK